MKKLSLLIAASAMATCACVAAPTWVKFSSVGPDKYADNTDVQDGEYYALVWTPTGDTFAGFAADGAVKSPSRLISRGRLAKDKHCIDTCLTLSSEEASLVTKGTFAVYLLDTRTRATAEDDLAVDATKSLTAVNTQSEVLANVVLGGKRNVSESAVTASAATVTDLPVGEIPSPRISGIQLVDGKVYVTVGDTVPYLQYGISSGDTPNNLEKNQLVNGVNGTESGDITLIVDNPGENRFFKVTRK